MTIAFSSAALQQMSTRAAFLIAGLAMSAWAPLVPYAKARLSASEGVLGLLLLCLGLGSLVCMPFAGILAGKFGCRRVIVVASIFVCTSLACLSFLDSFYAMAVALFLFGGSIATLDVAMNIQAVIVERESGRNMMSGFHGFYSLGGIFGAAGVSGLLILDLSPLLSVLVIVVIIFALLVFSFRHLLAYGKASGDPFFVMPHGKVILIGALCFIAFMAEGAVLDWSAVYLTSVRAMDAAQAGIGFAAFSISMTVARLTGDRIVKKLGGRRVVLWGGCCAAAGFLLVISVPHTVAALSGFALIGLGASNVVPVMFTAAGNQHIMPVNLAIAAVATMGYAGILAGPALIGWIAEVSNLHVSLGVVAVLLLLLASCARRVTATD